MVSFGVFCFFQLCQLAPPHIQISLHDLVTLPLGLLSSCFKKKPGGEGQGPGREARRRRG